MLWTLKDAFSAHYVERGYNSKQVSRVATALKELAIRRDKTHETEWQSRYLSFIRTHIDPLWWPDDVRRHVLDAEGWEPPVLSNPNDRSPLSPREEFSIRGATISRVELSSRLAESIDRFIETTEALRSLTDFYDNELIRRGFDIHVRQLNDAKHAKRLWDFARESRDLATAETLKLLSNRLLDFGDADASFDCLVAAYRRASDYWGRQPGAQSYLAELCARDANRVRDFFIEISQGAFQSDYGGFDLPQTIASFFAVSKQIPLLHQVFEDYLQHCQELFAHLPVSDRYAWLREYRQAGLDESGEVINFLIDLLGESEIDQGNRLLHVIADLANFEASLVCRAACERLSTAEPLLLNRLETLIDALSEVCPAVLADNAALLTPLLLQPNFRRRMTLAEVVRKLVTYTQLPSNLLAAVNATERAYTPVIMYPSRRFVVPEPSDDFVKFIERGALFDFRDRVRGVCACTAYPPGNCTLAHRADLDKLRLD